MDRYGPRRVLPWGFVSCFFFTPVSMFSVTTHQVAHIVDLGFEKMTAVNVLGILVLMLLTPAWGVGWLYDTTGSYRLAFGVAMASVGLACLSLWLAGGPRLAAGR